MGLGSFVYWSVFRVFYRVGFVVDGEGGFRGIVYKYLSFGGGDRLFFLYRIVFVLDLNKCNKFKIKEVCK